MSVIAIPAVYGSSESGSDSEPGNKWYPGKYLRRFWPVGVAGMLAAASMYGGVGSAPRNLVHQDFYNAGLGYATDQVPYITPANAGMDMHRGDAYAAIDSAKFDETKGIIVAEARFDADKHVDSVVSFANSLYRHVENVSKELREKVTARVIRKLAKNREFDEFVVAEIKRVGEYAQAVDMEAAKASRGFATAVAVKADAIRKNLHAEINATAEEFNALDPADAGHIEFMAKFLSGIIHVAVRELRDYANREAEKPYHTYHNYDHVLSPMVPGSSPDFAAIEEYFRVKDGLPEYATEFVL